MSAAPTSIHASAVKVGDQAVLIRGPSGSGKSRLAFGLIVAGRSGQVAKAELIADDRVLLERRSGAVLARTVPELAGLIEIRGLGIRRCPHVDHAPIGLVVDLWAADAARMPAPEALRVSVEGVELPRIPVGEGFDPLAMVVAFLITTDSVSGGTQLDDCRKENGNHISHSIVSE
ncbi:HPr kinase/phosphorylase [Rhodopseudomonas sp. B29]|uniref:HPr kinase/phosphorylase n=1 Tax=Rhodopseudomonas sp. B29 TaxID=95607 RepID=UPI000347F586|nr:HPr kinase/phosphatase C-terminal domain-containing protein [Rhodopseudomonas sp. B29]